MFVSVLGSGSFGTTMASLLASDMMTLARYGDTHTGPSRTGVDSYTGIAGDRIPGVKMDLRLLEGALADVLDYHATGKGREINAWWDPALNWGVVMAGRYPRLEYFESKNSLDQATTRALRSFEESAAQANPVLWELGLACPTEVASAALRQAGNAESSTFSPRLRIRNPRPRTQQRPTADPASGEPHRLRRRLLKWWREVRPPV